MKNIKKIIVTALIALMVMTGCSKSTRYEGHGEADPYPNVTNAD